MFSFLDKETHIIYDNGSKICTLNEIADRLCGRL